MMCEEQKCTIFFQSLKKDFDYEDPMSRPRVTLIGELKISK